MNDGVDGELRSAFGSGKGCRDGARDGEAIAGLGLGNGGRWERGSELASGGHGGRCGAGERRKKRARQVRVEEMSTGEMRRAPLRPRQPDAARTRRAREEDSAHALRASSTRRDARHLASAICSACRRRRDKMESSKHHLIQLICSTLYRLQHRYRD
jgi:hypothetical protein